MIKFLGDALFVTYATKPDADIQTQQQRVLCGVLRTGNHGEVCYKAESSWKMAQMQSISLFIVELSYARLLCWRVWPMGVRDCG